MKQASPDLIYLLNQLHKSERHARIISMGEVNRDTGDTPLSTTEIGQEKIIPVPSAQAKAFGSLLGHVLNPDIQRLKNDIRTLPDDTPRRDRITARFEEIPQTITALHTRRANLALQPESRDDHALYDLEFSTDPDRSLPSVGTIDINPPLLQQLVLALDDKFSNALHVVTQIAEVLDNKDIPHTVSAIKKRLKTLGEIDGIRVTTDEQYKKEFFMKRPGEEYTIVPLEGATSQDLEALAKKWQEQETNKEDVTLPKEIPQAFAYWIENYLVSLEGIPMENTDMQDSLHTMREKSAALATASEVRLVKLSDDEHGWDFEIKENENKETSPSPLKEQTITLFRPAATQFIRAVTNTFANPLAQIKGYAELFSKRGISEQTRERNTLLNEKATILEQDMKKISQYDADLDFVIGDDGNISITPRLTNEQ